MLYAVELLTYDLKCFKRVFVTSLRLAPEHCLQLYLKGQWVRTYEIA